MNWAKVFKVGLNIAGLIVPQINTIEAVANAIPGLKGSAKEDAALNLTKDVLSAAQVTNELLNDPQFEAAVRSYIQAYVALQNVAAKNPQATPQQ